MNSRVEDAVSRRKVRHRVMGEDLYSINLVCCFVGCASCRIVTIISSPRIVTMMYKHELPRQCDYPSKVKAAFLPISSPIF